MEKERIPESPEKLESKETKLSPEPITSEAKKNIGSPIEKQDSDSNLESQNIDEVEKELDNLDKLRKEEEKEWAEEYKKNQEKRLIQSQRNLKESVQGKNVEDQVTGYDTDTGDTKIDVPLENVKWPEGISGKEDFTRLSWEDAKYATYRLPDIQKSVNANMSREDFSEDDQRIYDLYYGDNPVKLYKVGEKITVEKGRHRVFMAKKMGRVSIPARVLEKFVDE